MGYIGNEPSVNFTSFAKQDITGNGGANYTLTHAVANENEIEVFVNNVRQEPSVAYTVSGTALTMTGNVASTDDFYVIYLGKALQTTTPPDGSVTSAKLDTNIAIDGDLTVDTSTLKVDSTNNRVGIGTSSPSRLLTVNGSTAFINIDSGANSNQRGIEFDYGGLQINGSLINFGATGETSLSGGASGSAGYFLTFKTNGTERSRIDGNGNIMFGSSSQLNAGKISVLFNGASQNGLILKNTHTGGNHVEFVNSSGTAVGTINQSGSTISYNTSSDHRLKENVTADWDATTRLKQLNPVRFNFIADADTTVDGFLAHEVQSVVPEAISGTHNEVDADGNPVYQGIDQSKLVPLLVKTIQELEARITALENS